MKLNLAVIFVLTFFFVSFPFYRLFIFNFFCGQLLSVAVFIDDSQLVTRLWRMNIDAHSLVGIIVDVVIYEP